MGWCLKCHGKYDVEKWTRVLDLPYLKQVLWTVCTWLGWLVFQFLLVIRVFSFLFRVSQGGFFSFGSV